MLLVAVETAAISGATVWEAVASAYLSWTLVTAFALVAVFVCALGPPGRHRIALAAALLGAAVSLPPLAIGYAFARHPESRCMAAEDVPSRGLTWGLNVGSSQVVCRFSTTWDGTGPVERRWYLLDLLDRSIDGDRVR